MPATGNGAREAILSIFEAEADTHEEDGIDGTLLVDRLLAELWARGFKVVPLDPADRS